jgi:hypothetical protein
MCRTSIDNTTFTNDYFAGKQDQNSSPYNGGHGHYSYPSLTHCSSISPTSSLECTTLDSINDSRHNDPAVEKAAKALKNHFINARGKPIKTPFFARQLQVLYEEDFFPRVIDHALSRLEHEEFLRCITSAEIPGLSQLKNVQKIKFYFNAKAEPSAQELYETMKKKAYNIARVVNAYSHPKVTDDLGEHLQSLLWQELRAQRFRVIGSNTNEYHGKEWTTSGQDVDHIAEHESGRLAIGLEAKNTLGIMPLKVIDEKIAICNHLGITPVFAVRWMKPYIHYIESKGGFCWIFKTQIYPYSYRDVVSDIFRRLSVLGRQNFSGRRLEFPVSASSRLPESSVKNFERWVKSKVDYHGNL